MLIFDKNLKTLSMLQTDKTVNLKPQKHPHPFTAAYIELQMREPSFTNLVFFNGAATVWDERKVYSVNSTKWTALDEHTVVLATADFKEDHSPLCTWRLSAYHKASKTFWPSWQWKQTLGGPEGRDHVPFPDLQKGLFFSDDSFRMADIRRCKITCIVSALRLWACSDSPPEIIFFLENLPLQMQKTWSI